MGKWHLPEATEGLSPFLPALLGSPCFSLVLPTLSATKSSKEIFKFTETSHFKVHWSLPQISRKSAVTVQTAHSRYPATASRLYPHTALRTSSDPKQGPSPTTGFREAFLPVSSVVEEAAHLQQPDDSFLVPTSPQCLQDLWTHHLRRFLSR